MKVAGSENTLQSAAKAKNLKLAFFSDLAEKSQNMKKAIKGLKEMLDMIFNLFFILVLIHFFRCLKRNELHYQACFFCACWYLVNICPILALHSVKITES